MIPAPPGLRLAWPQPPPDYPEHDGRPVRWDPWDVASRVHCIPSGCVPCGYGGRVWITWGTVAPEHPGAVVVERPTRTRSGRAYRRQEARPAPVARRLVAFRCPACGATQMWDMGEHGQSWALVDPSRPRLF
ncbi:hypothetical protein [Bailinhaonella thermotolerans]|uniref:Uncharacterized protein n=1 Tax=Bailinhaonella thermotolerans TaxID=1070861 RepID=A0A3A3ZXK5_9ACTN|nr:hypothetical protein [Bailinhaonella thermotolerans]RJL19748.1 hypothetical protein D5H75_40185 [Bailinhaonella thermotolerans]